MLSPSCHGYGEVGQPKTEINDAEGVIYEVTKVFTVKKKRKAEAASQALFGSGGADAEVPGSTITEKEFQDHRNIIDLLHLIKLIPSKGEGRRLIQQGGIYVNDERIEAIDHTLTDSDLKDRSLMIRKGKKVYHKVTVE